jgi:streptomycin 3"-adenylyltransferase
LETADEALHNYLSCLVDDLRGELGGRLHAIILHGSLGMGTFRPPKSDIDLLVLVNELSFAQASALYSLFERHHARRPYAGGLEASVISSSDARLPVHPLPSLVHFSETSGGLRPWPDGVPPTDSDLIAHMMVAKYRGHSLFGPSPDDVIGEVPWASYLDAVRGDIAWILEDENLLTTPYYGVLNLCRWAMMADTEGRIVPGKEEAGVWALSHLPTALRGIIEQSLAAYRSTDWPRTIAERRMLGGPWSRAALIAFRNDMRARYGFDAGNGKSEAI